ncbi:MAG: hypothetical protein JST50_23045 [Bacteroidetes bacterium]|jgi:hypothetical protein|nr:hypothetical protein [Bacteroidota bacterium]
MKLKRIALVVLALGALGYTSCKKSSSSNTVDSKTVASQIALNLSQTLYSGFGGFNLSSGLSAPGSFGLDRNALKLKLNKNSHMAVNDFSGDITCGLHVDTTFSASITADGGQATVAGSIGFTFNCTNGTFSGFNMTDNLKVTEATAQVNGTFNVAENLTLAQVNPGVDTSNISLNGTANFAENAKLNGKSAVISFNYTFNNVIIDQVGNLVSGSANFTTTGSGAQGTWNYTGTITFLGNGSAKLVINGVTYTINLQTGTVS